MHTPCFSIRHEIKGRIRFKIISKNLPETEVPVPATLESTRGILWVRENSKCSSVVVRYDPKRLGRDEIVELFETLFPPSCSSPQENTCTAGSCPTKSCSGHSHGVKPALRRFLGITAALGIATFRTSVLGLAVAQTTFSPLGFAAMAFTAPLVRNALARLREKRITLDGFLATGAIAAVTVGEAMTAFEILWINSGAELLTAWITERSRRSIDEILKLTSHHTFVLVDGVEVERDVEDVVPGETVVLHTGEKVSVDGKIIEGQALLNEAPLTGREEFVHRKVGDQVHAGTFVREGVIHVRADKVGDSTYLARVMHKVQDSLENRAPIEGVADKLASTLVKVGLGTTIATYVITASAWRAFTVLLVMACPCATVLAASTAISASMNAAARSRILVKGGRFMEEVGKCKTICFDKTGTLTTTEPKLVQIIALEGVDENSLLTMACSVEVHNHHPLAQAIKAEAQRRKITPVAHSVCDYHLGMGMRAVIEDDEILVGNARLAEYFKAEPAPLALHAQELRAKGLSVLYIFRNGVPQGVMGFAAAVRPEASNVVNRLRTLGAERFILITGDEPNSATPLADKLGFDECHCEIMPEQKADIVQSISKKNPGMLMIGDGINDALALAKADVGIAIGTSGSEVAVEAADIALASENLHTLADVYGLSQRTLRVVKQNFWLATGSNIVGVAMGVLGILSPVTAGLVHIGHTLGVVANSSRLLGFKASVPLPLDASPNVANPLSGE